MRTVSSVKQKSKSNHKTVNHNFVYKPDKGELSYTVQLNTWFFDRDQLTYRYYVPEQWFLTGFIASLVL